MSTDTPTTELRVLQRVILPPEGNLDVVPLYVETDMERGAQLTVAGKNRSEQAEKELANAVVGQTQNTVRFTAAHRGVDGAPDSRGEARIRAGRRVSFGTYFNAFPASYWRRWSVVESVTLRVRLSGDATVVVYRSTAKGHSHPVHTVQVDSDVPEAIEVTLPLTRFIDGGWYWFDVSAGSRDATVLEADWVSSVESKPHGRVSIGITTFNRPDFLLDLVRSIGEAADALDIIDKVYVVDQGTDRVKQHADFAEASKGLGDHLQVIEQGNLGGSGGFSRAMRETSQAATSDYLILLDDDVVLEPEGLLRAATFADLARRPTIVGGHMFSLHDRSVLNAFGETVAPYKWWWGAAPHTETNHDFGRQNLRNTPWLHRRIDADYNGWWMCLIPRAVIDELGLALPVFIKWDDAEYGLRATRAGYPVVSMPGVAVWHVPWQDKNDALDWQAYYHLRNRLIAALLHSPYERGGSVVGESIETQVQHLLSMQYSSAALRLLAIEDLLSGPDHMHRDLASKMAQLRALRAQYTDAMTVGDVEEFPAVRRRKPRGRDKEPTPPSNPLSLLAKAALGAARQLTRTSPAASKQPLLALPYQDAAWWRLSGVDSALVSSADGASAAWYRRDPQLFRELAGRSATLHSRLLREWPRLRAQYRAAAAEFTSAERWQETFTASTAGVEADRS